MKTKIFLTILSASVLFLTSSAFAGYFEKPASSPVLMHLAGSIKIGGEPAKPGDEIGIFDENWNIIGTFIVEKDGIFGDMAISGDVGLTGDIEGASNGERLNMKVWQQSTDTEYSGIWIDFRQPAEGKAIYAPYPEQPLQFESGFYLLNVEVSN